MRDCDNGELRDLLPDWIHDRLDAARAQRVSAHVASCPDCAEEVALLRDVGASLAIAAPKVNVAAIVAALPRPPRQRAWYQRTQLRAAAAVLFMVGVTSVALYQRTPVAVGDMVAAPAIEFAGGVGDLSEGDLTTLLREMEQLESTPSAEPDASNAPTPDLAGPGQ